MGTQNIVHIITLYFSSVTNWVNPNKTAGFFQKKFITFDVDVKI